jgi:ABC-type anion transport system duplicated permease subunit
MQNAGIYASKTTVQVNETDMQERRQKLLNLNKNVALMNPTLFLCREIPDITTVWKMVWEKLLSNQLRKVCIAFLRMKRITRT